MLKQYWMYLLLILVLLSAISMLVWYRSSTVTNNNKYSNIQNSSAVEYSNDMGQEKLINYSGLVVSWDPDNGVLTLEKDSKKSNYLIIPDKTRVLLGVTQNRFGSKQLSQISKSKHPLHWQSAFCPNDPISILYNPEIKEVRVVIDDGFRACGFKGVVR